MMATLPLVLYPEDILTTPAQPVDTFDEALHAFLENMAETMYASGGIGLAANQVGSLQRVTVIDVAQRDGESELLELINPQVVEKEGSIVWEEGCLSFPDLHQKVRRARHVKVTYQDRHGASHAVEGEGLFAVCLQHEIDHLDGICFIDRVSPLARTMALRRYKKLRAASDKERNG